MRKNKNAKVASEKLCSEVKIKSEQKLFAVRRKIEKVLFLVLRVVSSTKSGNKIVPRKTRVVVAGLSGWNTDFRSK